MGCSNPCCAPGSPEIKRMIFGNDLGLIVWEEEEIKSVLLWASRALPQREKTELSAKRLVPMEGFFLGSLGGDKRCLVSLWSSSTGKADKERGRSRPWHPPTLTRG